MTKIIQKKLQERINKLNYKTDEPRWVKFANIFCFYVFPIILFIDIVIIIIARLIQ